MSHSRWLSLFLLVILTACGSNESDLDCNVHPQPADGVFGQLPTPEQLARSASFADASQVRQGQEYETALPPLRTSWDFNHPTYITLNPATTPTLSPSVVAYSFDLTGYDEEPLVKLIWDANPENDTVYLALANWGENHWDFVATDPVNVTLPDLAPYISPTGKLILAVIAIGTAKHELRWLAIGDAGAPAKPVIYSVNPRSSQPGTQLTFIPQFSGTEPITFQWDFPAGADITTSSDVQPTITLGAAGDYDATLTMTNKYGSDVFMLQFHSVVPGWLTHSVGTAALNKFVALETTWTDRSLVAGEMNDGRISRFEFDKDGALVGNLAYTGLPANKVTDMVLVYPDANDPGEKDRATCYMAVYNDDGTGPGNAYIIRLDEDGSLMWYLPLGPGIPDVSRIDDDKFAASLARTDGRSVALLGRSDGGVEWAKETVEDAHYICSAGGSPALNEGMYLCGDKDGKATVLRVDPNGNSIWTTQLSENIQITSCAYIQNTALAITGTLPLGPDQKWDGFYLAMRLDTLLLFHEKFRTDPIRPEHCTYYDGFVFVSGGSIVPGEARVYVLNPLGELFRGLKVEGVSGLLCGDCRLTRQRPGIPDEQEPPEQPREQVIFAGSSTMKDVSVSTISATFDTNWRPLLTNVNADLQDSVLPTESLVVVPEPVDTYLIDAPAGDLDGIYMRATDVF